VTVTATRLTPHFAARIDGADVTQPLDDAVWSAIRAALDEHSVLVFHGAPMDDETQIAFSRRFGALEVTRSMNPAAGTPFARQSNLDIRTGEVIPPDDRRMIYQLANQLWHSDSSFQDPRAAYSMLHALVLPSWGGNTEFADLRAAYDALPDRTKAEVEELRAEHYALHTRILLGDEAYTDEQKKTIPPAVWPLVQTHPGSGRKLLFVGVHARQVIGWPTAESRMYLQDLLEHATQREFVYRHEWQVDDLVMWDNRSTLHRGRRYDIAERRELRRTTIENVPEARLMAA
jgi:alpha-ketoglutarate-dependent 2,4-dichlorophenoxyacetate dioxygenase